MKQLPYLLVGFALGAVSMCSVIVYSTNLPPATPELRAPTAIKAALYPWQGIVKCCGEPVEIPSEQIDDVYQLLIPETYFGPTVYESVSPIVAEVEITHADGTRTRMFVRDHGHNPAVVTLDGRNYFYARLDQRFPAGANELVGLVSRLAYAEKAKRESKP